MHCTITNLVDRPVLLRLNSGQTRHLEGNGNLADVLVVDVKDNDRIRRLVAKRLIRISDPKESKGQAQPSAKENPARAKKTTD